ncbi:MAG: amidase family protein [Bacteroidales bacterium]|jgi:amidase|nr:amidase family protein [Bacteroidales bacterium]
MKKTIYLLLLVAFACTPKPKTVIEQWVPYDESEEIAANADHRSRKMRFVLIQSRVRDKNDMLAQAAPQIKNFSEEEYLSLMPLIFEQDIPTIQLHIKSGALTYEKLTQWYIYRIVKFENDRDRYLNAVIAINPDAVKEARQRDKEAASATHPIYGMPVLLKDNINATGMATTAGAVALQNNHTTDAFIVKQLKAHGAIILGKTNLSEWANFLSANCPNGYSAVGGQTLNPYGRKIFDTGGSSSGSGAAMAANFGAAAVGTETSGSILSPSSKSSVAGLKPTVGLLSRSGIVPISSTYDTPGPMTRNLTDNAIMLSAMTGEDADDPITVGKPWDKKYWEDIETGTLEGLRFGVTAQFMRDSLYKLAVEKIAALGGVIVEFVPERLPFERFSMVLGADMKADLAAYLEKYASKEITFRSVAEITDFNREDTINRIPYGQTIFVGMLRQNLAGEELEKTKAALHESGAAYFDKPMTELNLDAVLSTNNSSAGMAAAAAYPCLAVPMGFSEAGEPSSLTFIGRPFEEDKLLKMAYAYEKATKMRQAPGGYR